MNPLIPSTTVAVLGDCAPTWEMLEPLFESVTQDRRHSELEFHLTSLNPQMGELVQRYCAERGISLGRTALSALARVDRAIVFIAGLDSPLRQTANALVRRGTAVYFVILDSEGVTHGQP